MRIVGLETEVALGFVPAAPDVAAPTQEALFEAVAEALKQDLRARPASYYKGGAFLADGSLLHFEVARIDAPHVGLLEWATPECLGGRQAAVYARAQEAALLDAAPRAEAALAERGTPGRLLLLKNNQDRAGNAYGCHESYDVRERPRRGLGPLLFAWALHPLVLALVGALVVAAVAPTVLLLLVPALLAGVAHALGALPLVGRPFRAVAGRLEALVAWLAEPGRGAGSGALARISLLVLRVGAALFDLTGPRAVLAGHLPALLPFLATRPVLAGAGVLTPDGRYELTARAQVLTRAVGAFIVGPRRPMVDIKELFFRRPLSWLAGRKRLHLLCGDANRADASALLKLETTELVLDAIEAGALDDLAAAIELRGGPAGALRATSSDPTLRRVVARDRRTHAPLTALDVQRRYLEAVWSWARERATPAQREALVRWRSTLERLEQDPRGLDRELDWAIKLRLLSSALEEALPGGADHAWALLAAWGPVNALLEAHAPATTFAPGDDPRRVVERALGPWRARRARRHVARAGLDWSELPAVRAAWLRAKALELRYHELSSDGGPFPRLVEAGAVVQALDPAEVERARRAPPAGTRAARRARWVTSEEAHVRVGWDHVLVGAGEAEDDGGAGEPPRRVDLSDPYRADG